MLIFLFFRPGIFKRENRNSLFYIDVLVNRFIVENKVLNTQHDFGAKSKPDVFKMFLWSGGLYIFMIA